MDPFKHKAVAPALAAALTLGAAAHHDQAADIEAVAALDTAYQAAVERSDWQAMDKILHPDFTLVIGRGKVFTRADLIESERTPDHRYEKQVEMPGTQTVRLFGPDTAVVTALLWIKGSKDDGSQFDYKLWFSDTYVRTKDGWKYAFGQASLPLPAESK